MIPISPPPTFTPIGPVGVATGDQLPPGCTCTHYITVLSTSPFTPGVTRAVCDRIQCDRGDLGHYGGGCWVLRVEDRILPFPCSDGTAPIIIPEGCTCGEPPGIGANHYGRLVRTFTWVHCKDTHGTPTLGWDWTNEPTWPEGEIVPNPVAESSINNNTSIELFEPFEIIENSNNITPRNISVRDSSQKEYIVILKGNDKIEHKVFMEKMISTNAVSLTETTSKIPSS